MAQSTQTDERLAEQASGGDRRALGAIFKRYHQDLFRYCAALLGNSEDAADALQNTMVKVLGALPGERRHVHLKPWLYRIAHNESVELLRKRREVDAIDPEALAGTHGPESSAETRERLRQLIVDLRELPERQRGALVMRELSGFSFEQIGSAFETSAAVARQTVYEARIGLQEMERGRAMECDEVRRKLSDGDRRVIRRRDVRAHLRQCATCREFEESISSRRVDMAAISPLPVLAAAGLLKGVLGGAAGSAGGTAAGAGAAGGAISASAAAKTVATVAVAGAIGVGAADQAGVVRALPDTGSGDAPASVKGDRATSTPSANTAALPETVDRARSTGVGKASTAPASRVSAPSKSEGGETDARPGASPGGPPSAATRPQGQGPSSAGGVGKGHEKLGGKGAGSVNAHGGNPNAMGGNPNAKGGDGRRMDPPGAGQGPPPPRPESQAPIDPIVPPPQAQQGLTKAGEPPGLGKPER